MSVRICSVNTDWAKRHDGAYLAHLAHTCDVILVQEAKDTDLHAAAAKLPRGPWTAVQSTVDDAHKGTGILVRDQVAKVTDHHLTLGVHPFLRTRHRVKMLTRYIVSAHLDIHGGQLYVVSAHFPPMRFAFLQPLYRTRLRAVVRNHPHCVVGVDANQPIGNVAKALGMRAHGKGIVGLLTAPGVSATNVQVRSWGIRHHLTDHPTVEADCTPAGVH